MLVNLIENSFDILLPNLAAKQELIQQIYEFSEFGKIISEVLISCSQESLRKSFSYMINTICMSYNNQS